MSGTSSRDVPAHLLTSRARSRRAPFAEAVKDGHAYVSSGPLIFPAVMFGSELKLKPGARFALAFDLKSVAGLKQASLVGAGTVVATRSFQDSPRETSVEFPLTADGDAWYALEVEDTAGRMAYSNPIWVDVELAQYPPPNRYIARTP